MKPARSWAVAALCCAGFAAHAAAEADREVGRQLFNSGTQPSCAVCHTLRDAGAQGAVGPVLDELQPDETRVANVLRTGLGVMPSFRDKLTDAQIALLARYVALVSAPPR
jgi:cytochrome c6